MTYHPDDLTRLHQCAENAAIKPVARYGISVYVDSDPDTLGADFVIDPADEQGIAIFREFAAKMATHFNTLKK